jgi:hypothetical protein
MPEEAPVIQTTLFLKLSMFDINKLRYKNRNIHFLF